MKARDVKEIEISINDVGEINAKWDYEIIRPQQNANGTDTKWREETWRLRKLDALQGMQANPSYGVPTWTFSRSSWWVKRPHSVM